LDARVVVGAELRESLNPKPDAVLIIAPERGGELQRITAQFRRRKIQILGAGEKSIGVSGNKWLTYLALEDRVPQPRTWKKLPELTQRILIKPIDGVGCEGIGFASVQSDMDGTIFQEFLEGEHASCCLLMNGDGGTVLSVNKQNLVIENGEFRYWGSEIPLRHELSERCAEIALRAAEILNLRGYCGVDLVIGDMPYLVEVNPRLTTSFIALVQLLDVNLGELLVQALLEGSRFEPKIKKHSVVKLIEAKRDIQVDVDGLNKLREIKGVIAPPFALDGKWRRGTRMLFTGAGKNPKSAERKFKETVGEVLSLLGVDEGAVAWS
jgi:hypothetical protein